jgi:uncharacterized protein Yka (UPF0111/DUF47 family)
MSKFAPPPSPEATIAELEEIEKVAEQNANEIAATMMMPEPEIEMISVGELLLLNIETRIGRIADALETAAKAKAASRNDVAGLTAQVNRIADALESLAAVFGCVTESTEGKDGVSRCHVRTRDDNHSWFLADRDDRED